MTFQPSSTEPLVRREGSRMVDPNMARKLYEVGLEAFKDIAPNMPTWDELSDEDKEVWEQHAHDYERKDSNGTDD